MAKAMVNISRQKNKYYTEYRSQLATDLKLDNINQVPKLQKIVINVGLGRAKDDKKLVEQASNTLRKITGQQPVETTARMSIATFKLREGMKIGIKVTLRGERMYEFLDRLITIVLPRVRDFHGVSETAFDRQGNYSIGLTDQTVFPELSFEDTTTLHGLQIIMVIDNGSPDKSRALLEKFGIPFEKPKVVQPAKANLLPIEPEVKPTEKDVDISEELDVDTKEEESL